MVAEMFIEFSPICGDGSYQTFQRLQKAAKAFFKQIITQLD